MYQLISKYQFTDAFACSGTYKNQFSYQGLKALYDYLENDFYTASNEHGIQLDIAGLCCVWSEYDSIEDYNQQLEEDYNSPDELSLNCIVIPIDGGGFIAEQY